MHQCEYAVCEAGQDVEMLAYHQHINLVLSRLGEAERRWYIASLSSGLILHRWSGQLEKVE